MLKTVGGVRVLMVARARADMSNAESQAFCRRKDNLARRGKKDRDR
jgi:uncharacterized protein with PhoU and TrkA domain